MNRNELAEKIYLLMIEKQLKKKETVLGTSICYDELAEEACKAADALISLGSRDFRSLPNG